MVEVSTHPPEFDASGRERVHEEEHSQRELVRRRCVGQCPAPPSPKSDRRIAACLPSKSACVEACGRCTGCLTRSHWAASARQLIDTLFGGIALWPFAPLGR